VVAVRIPSQTDRDHALTRPIIFTPRRSNSSLSFANAPSSVVHTGVKSAGWENRMAQLLPMNSWKSISPCVVFALKLGAGVQVCYISAEEPLDAISPIEPRRRRGCSAGVAMPRRRRRGAATRWKPICGRKLARVAKPKARGAARGRKEAILSCGLQLYVCCQSSSHFVDML
jgi:hypothetical protein